MAVSRTCPVRERLRVSALSDSVIEQARTWLGVPFRHQGRTRHGVDCVGLVLCVYADVGIELPDNPVYERETSDQRLEQLAGKYFRTAPIPERGDILQYRVQGFPTPHVAIYTGETIIHAFYKHQRVIEQVPWRRGPITLSRVLRFNG